MLRSCNGRLICRRYGKTVHWRGKRSEASAIRERRRRHRAVALRWRAQAATYAKVLAKLQGVHWQVVNVRPKRRRISSLPWRRR